jgi:hypothetical protein
MTTVANSYGCSASKLINTAEALDYRAHTTRVDRGQWLLLPLQLLTGAAVLVGRRLERLNG